MASEFSSSNIKCDGCDSEFKPNVTYRLEVKQYLCIDCAREKQDNVKGVEKDARCFCYKHEQEEAKVFCETHQKSICHVCAVTSDHKPCQTKCIGDVIEDRKHQLAELKNQCKNKEDAIHGEGTSVDHQSFEIANYLQMVKREIETAIEEERREVETTRNDMTTKINGEADEEIKKINEKRERRLKQNQNDRSHLLDNIKKRGTFLEEKMEWTVKQFQQTKERLKYQIHELSQTVHKACENVDKVLIDDKRLMTNFHDTIGSLSKCLQRDINVRTIDTMREIAMNVSFVRIAGQEIGRIDGVDEIWEECDSVKGNPILIGAVSDYEIVTKNKRTGIVSVMNLRDKSRNQLRDGFAGKMKCCFPLSDTVIVCGTSDGKIVISDRTWKVIRTIRVKANTPLHVSGDKGGMILAVAIGDPIIYVYNPDSGSLVRRIEVRVQDVREVHDLSSGDMVVRCRDNVCVFDASGKVKHAIKPPNGQQPVSLQVDRSCDQIYVSYQEELVDEKFRNLSPCVSVYSNGTLITESITRDYFFRPNKLILIPQSDKMIARGFILISIMRKKKKSLVTLLQN